MDRLVDRYVEAALAKAHSPTMLDPGKTPTDLYREILAQVCKGKPEGRL